ncbi:MAG: nickel-dependent hydrogenase large subunit, partial [Candidatus Aminicenantes bacterium]
ESDGSFLYPEGTIENGSLTASSRAAIEPNLTEDVTKAWYVSTTDGHPSQTTQEFDLDKADAYSFVKAPRFNNQPMEVGPLARLMVTLQRPSHPTYNHQAVQAFKDALTSGITPGAVGRHLARALETQVLCDAMVRWLNDIESMVQTNPNSTIHDTAHWEPPTTGQAYGMIEAPRGALGHWVRIANSVIDQYACVVPTTWNAAPMDSSGAQGPVEKALLGCPVPDLNNPINVGRVIRSFDPCLACAVHILTPAGQVKKFIVNR